jgi:hypothetical protein
MIVLLAVAVIVVGFLIFRATTPGSSARATATPANVASLQSGSHGAKRAVAAPRAKPTPTVALAVIQRRTQLKNRKQYAASIVPTLARTASAFDQAAGAASRAAGNFDALQAQCTSWGSKILALETQYEGIPHPYVWWSPAGTLHHQTSGIFHYMLGAIQNCQEAIQSSDSDGAATAVSQMATGARDMHAQVNYARYLATQRGI